MNTEERFEGWEENGRRERRKQEQEQEETRNKGKGEKKIPSPHTPHHTRSHRSQKLFDFVSLSFCMYFSSLYLFGCITVYHLESRLVFQPPVNCAVLIAGV